LEVLLNIVRKASTMFPCTELILGCMRTHLSTPEVCRLIDSGIRGIVNPPKGLKERLSDKIIIEKDSCCSF